MPDAPKRRTLPKHGTRTEYVKHGCRCDPCREATRIYERERRAKNPLIREQDRAHNRRYRERDPKKRERQNQDWRKRNPERAAENQRRRSERFRLKQYAIDAEAHALLLSSQDGKCAICQQPDRRQLSVDHEHGTGRIRGLLCRACNLGLGCFRDNPQTLRAAIDYLTVT